MSLIEAIIVGLRQTAVALDERLTEWTAINPMPLIVWIALGLWWAITAVVVVRAGRGALRPALGTLAATALCAWAGTTFGLDPTFALVWGVTATACLLHRLPRALCAGGALLLLVVVASRSAHVAPLLGGVPLVLAWTTLGRIIARRGETRPPESEEPLE